MTPAVLVCECDKVFSLIATALCKEADSQDAGVLSPLSFYTLVCVCVHVRTRC